MKNNQKKGLLISSVFAALFIDAMIIFNPSQLNWLAKTLIVGLTGLGQLVAIWGIVKMKPWPKKEQKTSQKSVYSLTVKTYVLLSLTASSIYTVGIWLLTPPTHPSLIKNLALGVLLTLQLVPLLIFSFKKVHEKADERFYSNLAKAATLVFSLSLVILLLLATVSALMGSITVNAGLFFIAISLLVWIFDFAYFLFERWG